ncbi:transposase [Paraburkholderia sp. MM5477-R1]
MTVIQRFRLFYDVILAQGSTNVTQPTVAQPQAPARLQAVLEVIEQQKLKWSLTAGVHLVVSYEAGQDAFWIYRALRARGIECHVVDPASIPV